MRVPLAIAYRTRLTKQVHEMYLEDTTFYALGQHFVFPIFLGGMLTETVTLPIGRKPRRQNKECRSVSNSLFLCLRHSQRSDLVPRRLITVDINRFSQSLAEI